MCSGDWCVHIDAGVLQCSSCVLHSYNNRKTLILHLPCFRLHTRPALGGVGVRRAFPGDTDPAGRGRLQEEVRNSLGQLHQQGQESPHTQSLLNALTPLGEGLCLAALSLRLLERVWQWLGGGNTACCSLLGQRSKERGRKR